MSTTQEVSGKVFRFLSAMHPSLSKSERKRYAGFDPDKWYPWTPEVSAEFTDLMRRSPRDTSFARGFTYVAQRAVPEGRYVPTTDLLANLGRLPAAFRGPQGSGYEATVDGPGHARVVYSGMPGFSNACIAIQGELTQRMQASGAQGVIVKHGSSCRVNGADVCEFEVEWSGETPPPDAEPLDLRELLGDEVATAEPVVASGPPPEPAQAPEQRAQQAPAAAVEESAAEARPAGDVAAELGGGQSSEDLFVQLRKRLAEADRHAQLYRDAQQEIDRLKVELSRLRAQAQADVAQAEKERDEAREALATLKDRIRTIVADD